MTTIHAEPVKTPPEVEAADEALDAALLAADNAEQAYRLAADTLSEAMSAYAAADDALGAAARVLDVCRREALSARWQAGITLTATGYVRRSVQP